jgi:hypothetical protein
MKLRSACPFLTRGGELITRNRVISTAAVADNKPYLQFRSIVHD